MKEINFNFLKRHLGPNDTDIDLMLKSMSFNTIDELIKRVIPSNILSKIDEESFQYRSRKHQRWCWKLAVVCGI